jgi:hypothetical protein
MKDPSHRRAGKRVARRSAPKHQAEGESLDPFRADRIFALDERLTRQLEKTLAMLVSLRVTPESAAGP